MIKSDRSKAIVMMTERWKRVLEISKPGFWSFFRSS